MGLLVYKNGLATGATNFLTILDTLLTNAYSSSDPRGLGWTKTFDSDSGNTTTITAGINASVATIPATSTTGFQIPGTIIIDNEQISYSGTTPTSFTGCLRGINGTTAAIHISASDVFSMTDKLYFSRGSGDSERILLRLTVRTNDTEIDRQIAQISRDSDGYMLNAMGAGASTRMGVGSTQFIYWIVGNQDFIHIVILVGSTYSHYYSGIINRFAPNQNSSIYGQSAPVPTNTTTPAVTPFTVGTNTVLFLRTGFDNYGGYDANNLCFQPGQKLYIIDQSLGTSTTGNQGVVILNSVDLIQNTINVNYLSGNNVFSSFSIVSIDPQPVALSTGGTIRNNPFIMLDDYIGDIMPQFDAVNEFAPGTGLPPEGIQNPDIRGVYVSVPIRLFNTQEIRGTLYGIIDIPVGGSGAQDFFQTFDQLYRFIAFPDDTLMVAIGSII